MVVEEVLLSKLDYSSARGRASRLLGCDKIKIMIETRKLLLALTGLAVLVWWGQTKRQKEILESGWENLRVGSKLIQVEVRDTTEGRNKGLSGREPLADDEGMLFVFPVKANYPFWMKEMKFDLDFIWIDGDTVMDITEGVKAPIGDQRLEIVKPKVAVNKILEVNSGFVSKNNIKVGDKVEWR